MDNATIPDQEEEQWNSTLVLQDVIVSKENSNHGTVTQIMGLYSVSKRIHFIIYNGCF